MPNKRRKLTPAELELRRLNRQLHQIGEHVCTRCLVRMLRNAQNFDRNKHSGGFDSICKTCKNFKTTDEARERYQNDTAYRERRKEVSRKSYEKHREERIEGVLRYQRKQAFKKVFARPSERKSA